MKETRRDVSRNAELSSLQDDDPNATGLSFDSIPLLPEDIFEKVNGIADPEHGGSNDFDPDRLGEFLPEVNA